MIELLTAIALWCGTNTEKIRKTEFAGETTKILVLSTAQECRERIKRCLETPQKIIVVAGGGKGDKGGQGGGGGMSYVEPDKWPSSVITWNPEKCFWREEIK